MMRLVLALLVVVAVVSLVEGGCNRNTGYERRLYSSKERYTVACGFMNWGRCNRYKRKEWYGQVTCRVNGGWSGWRSWSAWNSCSKTCGAGIRRRSRTRSCNNPLRRNGGSYCPGSSTDYQNAYCKIRECPRNGGWSSWRNWGTWSSCSKTCGTGTSRRERTRSCSNPTPLYGGKQCIGIRTDTQIKTCKKPHCPIDGNWSQYTKWSKWTECSATCGEGLQRSKRTRTCTAPKPQHGGKKCIGLPVQQRSKKCKAKECPVYCECSTVGDVHYKAFDGNWISFRGACRYQLSKSVGTTKCQLSVIVTNEAANENKELPYTRSIDLTINKDKILLRPKKVVFVNGLKVNLPYKNTDRSLHIFQSGRLVRVETNCDVIAEWDGKKNFELAIPDSFSNKMTGICGECKREKTMSTKQTNSSAIAKEFALRDVAKASGQTCAEIVDIPEVSDEMSTIAESEEYCGLLRLSGNATSPFKECIETKGIDVEEYYDICKMDVSIYHDNYETYLETAICNILEAFAVQCEEKEVSAKWRSKNMCPLKCGKNQEYSPLVSGCQANCVDKNSEKTCELPSTEGCACKKGYILSGNECVKESKCGCNSKIGYIELGAEVLSHDCKTLYQCKKANGKAAVKEFSKKCHDNGVCHINADGESSCKCEKNFKGDGVKECKDLTKCRREKGGKHYRGHKNTTLSGKQCQAWASQSPHHHGFVEDTSVDGNYCRNPDGEPYPWCYTTDPAKRWEFCDIPMCEVEECKRHKQGKEYAGKKSTTVSGKQCQAWKSQSPHKHRFSSQLSLDSNYCRNPDGEPHPWCYTADPNTRWEFCQISMCEVKECKPDPKGTEYNGHKNTTKSGKTCQAWSSQSPHKHSFAHDPSVQHNYCRNPDNEPHPWCYTTDPKKRWEFCEIPACDEQ